MENKLAELLLEQKVVSEDVINEALEIQKETGLKLGDCILKSVQNFINNLVPKTLGVVSGRCSCIDHDPNPPK